MRPQKTNSINPEWNITSFNMQVILIWSPSHHIMNMWWLCYHHAFIQTLGKNTTTRLSFFGQRMITWWKATPMQRKCIESIGKSTDHPSISSMLQHVATTQTNVRYDTMIRWFHDTMIRWYDECDTMILCYSDTMIRWCDDTMIRWYDDTTILWYDDTMRRWYDDTMIRWHDDTMIRWYYDTMIRWHDDAMLRWYDGTMIRW